MTMPLANSRRPSRVDVQSFNVAAAPAGAEIIVGVDLGSTKVTAVAAEIDGDELTILGQEIVPCAGLQKGMVANIQKTSEAIGQAIRAVENMAAIDVESVYVNVAGEHLSSLVSQGVAAISRTDVSADDRQRALDGARAVPIDSDREILHVLPRQYLVDNQDGIRDPIGMSGVRLQVIVTLATAAKTAIRNVTGCVERQNLRVADVIASPLASAEAVVTDDEKEIGVAVIDLGGGTTDLLLYAGGGVEHMAVMPAGGSHVTSDLSAGLRCPLAEAERLKRHHGSALARTILDGDQIELTGIGGRGPRFIARRVLAEIIEPRMAEIFTEVRSEIQRRGMLDRLGAGVVLTGGSVVMDGVAELASEVLGLPVRIAAPSGLRGVTTYAMQPSSSAAVGLVMVAARRLREQAPPASMAPDPRVQKASLPAPGRKVAGGFLNWLKAGF